MGEDPRDPKSQLINFLQKKYGKTLGKQDLQISVEKYEEGHQATLWLPVVGDGMEFVGELGDSAKQAEKLAAQQALDTYSDEIQAMNAGSVHANKRKRDENAELTPTRVAQAWQQQANAKGTKGGKGQSREAPKGAASPAPGSTASNPKNRLNSFLQRTNGRPIGKDDFVYDVVKYEEGWQCTLTLHCMGGVVFVSEVVSNGKDAQNGAAQMAVDSYAHDIASLSATTKPASRPDIAPAKTEHPKGGAAFAALMQKGKGKGFQEQMMLAFTKGQAAFSAKGKGATTKGGPAMPLVSKGAAMKGGPLQGSKMGKGKGPLPQRALAGGAPVRALGGLDASKCILNTFLQRFLGRPVTKQDLEWSIDKDEGGNHQATLTLHCLSGEVYVSERVATEKEAMEVAAQRALEEHAQDIAALPEGPAKKKQKKNNSAAGDLPSAGEGPAMGTSDQHKMALNGLVQKILGMLGQTLTKNQITYETTKGEDGTHQSVVSVDSIQDASGSNVWTGEASSSKQLAEHSAARMAVEAIMDTPEHADTLQDRANRPPKERPGKGEGKGKDKN